MPKFVITCEVCGKEAVQYRRKDRPPRFCGRECRAVGLYGQSFRPVKWIITPEIHERIKDTYQKGVLGDVKELCKVVRLPRWKVSRYAVAQGWVARQTKEPAWSEAETHILEQAAHLSLPVIQRRLKKQGFSRTQCGIQLKRKRMRCLRNLKGQSAREVAEVFGVDAKCITLWIKKGWLVASRRGTSRTSAQGGDMFFIKERAIRKFIITYVEVIDFRKIDKYYLVDLLAGGAFGTGAAGKGDTTEEVTL